MLWETPSEPEMLFLGRTKSIVLFFPKMIIIIFVIDTVAVLAQDPQHLRQATTILLFFSKMIFYMVP